MQSREGIRRAGFLQVSLFSAGNGGRLSGQVGGHDGHAGCQMHRDLIGGFPLSFQCQ